MTMSTLEATQRVFLQALNEGPDRFRSALFAGSKERALLGMMVHANTVSHARLVALEDSFPRLRVHLGAERFNILSRHYLEYPGVRALSLAYIGRSFADFVEAEGEAPDAHGLARFEWAWLESYHAADKPALQMSDLAAFDENALIDLTVGLHPATRLIRFADLPPALLADELPSLALVSSVLLTRPQGEVSVSAASPVLVKALSLLQAEMTIRNFLKHSGEKGFEEAAIPTLMDLINRGALVLLAGDDHNDCAL